MTTPLERLETGFYNSRPYDFDTNPGGLAAGGHVINLPALLQDIGSVGGDLAGVGLDAITGLVDEAVAARDGIVSITDLSRETNWSWAIRVAEKVVAGAKDRDFHLAHAGPSSRISIGELDRANLGFSERFRTRHGIPLPLGGATHSFHLGIGQSKMTGGDGQPGLNTGAGAGARADCLMFGQSPNSLDNESVIWAPRNGAALYTLGDYTEGHPLTLSTRALAAFINDRPGSPGKKFVANSVAVPSKSIEERLPGTPGPEYFQRYASYLTAAKAAVVATPGATCEVSAVTQLDGESNSQVAEGGDMTYAGNLALLESQYSYVLDQITTNIGAQLPPAWLLQVVSGSYLETHEVCNAQIDWALAKRAAGAPVWAIGSDYWWTNKKGGHLDANGYSWWAAYIGKVLIHTLGLGLDWAPTMPLWIRAVHRTVYIGFHAPVPPLQFGTPYFVSTPEDYDHKGFGVRDANGPIKVLRAEIIPSTIVALHCETAPDPATGMVKGAIDPHYLLCLRDSDARIATAQYQAVGGAYLDATNPWPESNRPELIGKGYPLFNPCIPFDRPIGWSLLPA